MKRSIHAGALGLIVLFALGCPNPGTVDPPVNPGGGTPPQTKPAMAIFNGSGDLASGLITIAFSADTAPTYLGSLVDLSFSIRNSGDANLVLSAAPTIGGANATSFSVLTAPALTVAPGITTTCMLRFAPQAAGALAGTVTVLSNDATHPTVTFGLSGFGAVAPTPEIDILRADTAAAMASGESYAFASKFVGEFAYASFTIKSLGSQDLTLTGTPAAQISGDAAFSIVTQPSPTTLANGQQATCQVKYQPTAAGSQTATLTIASNDADEANYTILLAGTSLAPPVMTLKKGSAVIPSSYAEDFGSVALSGSKDVVYTIENAGPGDLHLVDTGSGVYVKSLADGSNGLSLEYSVLVQPAATIAAGSSTSFTLRFKPTTFSSGNKISGFSFATDNPVTGGRSFDCTGYGYKATMAVKEGAANALADGTSTVTWNSLKQTATADKTFTITSAVTTTTAGYAGALVLDGSPLVALSGTGAAQFSVTASPAATSLANTATTTFVLRFAPTAIGTHTATVSISSNAGTTAPDPFTFTITGTAAEWSGTKSVLYGVGNKLDLAYYYNGDKQLVAGLTDTSGGDALVLLTSDAGMSGASWSTAATVVRSGNAMEPSLALYLQDAYLASYDYGTPLTLAYNRMTRASGAWAPAISDLSYDPTATVGRNSDILVDPNNSKIFISYWDMDNGNLMVARNAFNGTAYAWTTSIVDATPAAMTVCDSAVDWDGVDGHLFIAYYDGAGLVKFVKTTTWGTGTPTWSAPVTVATGVGHEVGSSIQMKVDGSRIYLVYYDKTNLDLVFAGSSDAGATWTKTTIDSVGDVGFNSSIDVYDPTWNTTTTNDTTIVLAWVDRTNNDLKFTKSTDSGATWLAASMKTVDNDAATGGAGLSSPAIVYAHSTDKDRIYIGFAKELTAGGRYFWLAKSIDLGATW